MKYDENVTFRELGSGILAHGTGRKKCTFFAFYVSISLAKSQHLPITFSLLNVII